MKVLGGEPTSDEALSRVERAARCAGGRAARRVGRGGAGARLSAARHPPESLVLGLARSPAQLFTWCCSRARACRCRPRCRCSTSAWRCTAGARGAARPRGRRARHALARRTGTRGASRPSCARRGGERLAGRARRPAAALPYVDAFVAWGSVLATWMVARKVLENWLYWIVLDAVAAVLYCDARAGRDRGAVRRSTSCSRSVASGMAPDERAARRARRPRMIRDDRRRLAARRSSAARAALRGCMPTTAPRATARFTPIAGGLSNYAWRGSDQHAGGSGSCAWRAAGGERSARPRSRMQRAAAVAAAGLAPVVVRV